MTANWLQKQTSIIMSAETPKYTKRLSLHCLIWMNLSLVHHAPKYHTHVQREFSWSLKPNQNEGPCSCIMGCVECVVFSSLSHTRNYRSTFLILCCRFSLACAPSVQKCRLNHCRFKEYFFSSSFLIVEKSHEIWTNNVIVRLFKNPLPCPWLSDPIPLVPTVKLSKQLSNI